MQTTPTKTVKKISIAALSVAAVCVLASWGYKQTQYKYEGTHQVHDTVPKQKVGDFDETLRQLDEAERQLSGPELKAKISAALSQLDAEKIKLQVQSAMKEAEQAMKSIDLDKIQQEIEQSLAKVDFDKMKAEMEKALVTAKEDMKRAKEEMKTINKAQIEKELKSAYDEIEKMKPELEKSMKNMEFDLSNAKVEIEKARVEVKDYKTIVEGLEKDGLLDSKKNYTLEHKDGALYINGEKVSQDVYKKHESLLKKYPELKIKKTEKSLNITKDKEEGVEI